MTAALRGVLLPLAVVLLASGCLSPEPSSTRSDEPRQVVVPLAAPPERVPDARLRGVGGAVAGEVVYSSWVVEGKVREHESPGVSGQVAPTQIVLGEPFTIELATEVWPVRVHLLAYRSVGKGEPPSGKVHEAECLPEPARGDCTYRSDRTVVTVRTRLDQPARVVLLNVGWQIPREFQERSPTRPFTSEVSAAWAFLIAPTSKEERPA